MQKLQTRTLLVITAVLCLLVFVSVGALAFLGSEETETEKNYTYYFNNGTTVYESDSAMKIENNALIIEDHYFDGIPLYYEEGVLLTADMIFYPMTNYDTYKVDVSTALEIKDDEIQMTLNNEELSYL